jgi:poly(3-hydroxybutyrate) depolymerase
LTEWGLNRNSKRRLLCAALSQRGIDGAGVHPFDGGGWSMVSGQRLSEVARLPAFRVAGNQNSVSGLSSGAFMTVQLHLAHSASFVGAGVIAGGPYRCAETLRGAALAAEDAYALNALYICMTPLTPNTGPNADYLADLARQTAADGRIDPIANLANHRLYIFTGSRDEVVSSTVVESTRQFYERLGVAAGQIQYIDTVPAGHSIVTDNVEDSPLAANQPPYINYGGFTQSHDILRHIYGDLQPPAEQLSAALTRFDQAEFLEGEAACASMGEFGYVYVPKAVQEGEEARGVHIALHGCKQGYSYVNFAFGRADSANQPPYGARYMTTTGYNQIADSNNIIVLYPQATGDDDNQAQNPDGCWDWWGYTSADPNNPDYYSRDAVQIRAIHAMLQRLCGG